VSGHKVAEQSSARGDLAGAAPMSPRLGTEHTRQESNATKPWHRVRDR
jgi:hypothetical protein